jgi:hypothetical protein
LGNVELKSTLAVTPGLMLERRLLIVFVFLSLFETKERGSVPANWPGKKKKTNLVIAEVSCWERTIEKNSW